MEIVDHLFFSLESARNEIYGFDYHDDETGITTNVKGAKDGNKDAEKYYETVSKLYFNLTTSVDELLLAAKFLKIFDLSFYNSHDIKKSDYVTYHIKFWHIKSV